MSQSDKDHFQKIASLLPTEGGWRWVALLIAIPSIIGSLTAAGAGLIWMVSFSVGVKYAVTRVPLHDSLINAVAVRESETRDTLQHHGYSFRP